MKKTLIICLLAVAMAITTLFAGCGEVKTEEISTPSCTDFQPTVKPAELITPAPTEEQTEQATETEAPTEELQKEVNLDFPEDNMVFSKAFAEQAAALNFGSSAEDFAAILTGIGLKVQKQEHFDKSADDRSHTSAYTVATGAVTFKGEKRTVVAIVIRGTSGAEWYSNLDFAPSHDDDAIFAENFYAAAKDIYDGAKEYLTEGNPLILVTGYSRGAACANLLGFLINSELGWENSYIYTFATPTTIRREPNTRCDNIFNIINSADTVTKLPLENLGYRRLGTDIILEGDVNYAKTVEEWLATLNPLAVSISDFYNKKYSVYGAGTDDNGATLYDMMEALASALTTMDGTGNIKTSGLVKILQIGDESDLVPVRNIVSHLLEDNGAGFTRVFSQHMPAVYQELLDKLQ